MPWQPITGKGLADRYGTPPRDRYPDGMRGCKLTRPQHSARPLRLAAAAVLVAFAMLLSFAARPVGAFDLFATHQVTAQFATADGKPMANAEVRVFAPGESTTPVETGRTDASGKFVFDADRDGMWSAEARTPTEVARVTIRVGGASQVHGRLNPFLVIGALGLLLVAAFWYRLRRIRPRPPKS
jgi:hypothetical protein